MTCFNRHLFGVQVENCVVGAPCGIMDQMTSALGQAGALLALRCQPAEMLDPVAVPPSVRLWGIDSGIRHRRAHAWQFISAIQSWRQ